MSPTQAIDVVAAPGQLRVSREAGLERLPDFIALAERACVLAGVDAQVASVVRLVVEEVASNVIRHGYGGRAGPLALTIAWDARRIRLDFEDRAPPFTPPATLPPPLHADDWETREPGGLGWLLIRRSVDDIRHRHRAHGGNHLTLTKNLQS